MKGLLGLECLPLPLPLLPPPSSMATKMKGFFKGFKYISQIFVYKEHELEIGYPTDVRHVAHIGWDSASVNAPSWMNEFKTASDFSSTSLSNFGQSRETSWASQDFDHARGIQPPAVTCADAAMRPDIPKAPKKTKRKKTKVSSSPSSSTRSSTRSTRSTRSRAASFATAMGGEVEELPTQIRVI